MSTITIGQTIDQNTQMRTVSNNSINGTEDSTISLAKMSATNEDESTSTPIYDSEDL